MQIVDFWQMRTAAETHTCPGPLLKYEPEVAVKEGFSAPESYPRQCCAALWGAEVGTWNV